MVVMKTKKVCLDDYEIPQAEGKGHLIYPVTY